MKYRELVEDMKRLGWYLDDEGDRLHRVWRHSKSGNPVTIPDREFRELTPGLVRAIGRMIAGACVREGVFE